MTDFNALASGQFVFLDAAHTDTTQLQEVRQGDYIRLQTPTNYDTVRGSDSLLSSSHPLYIQDSSGAYDADRLINTVNYRDIYTDGTDTANNRNYPNSGNLLEQDGLDLVNFIGTLLDGSRGIFILFVNIILV